ncbi:hypothetical protein UlMin_030123 [Ulmus minor]
MGKAGFLVIILTNIGISGRVIGFRTSGLLEASDGVPVDLSILDFDDFLGQYMSRVMAAGENFGGKVLQVTKILEETFSFLKELLIKILIVIILNRVDLSDLEAEASLDFLLNDLDEALIGAFLVLMRAKGETYEEQGSCSSSSACGSANVLEEMGVVIDLEPEGVTRRVNKVGIGFMISPIYHPAMKVVRPIRKKLKVKTVFNVLGPMLNLARVPYAVVGVYAEDLLSKILQQFEHSSSQMKPLEKSFYRPKNQYSLVLCIFMLIDMQSCRNKLRKKKGFEIAGSPEHVKELIGIIEVLFLCFEVKVLQRWFN